MLILLNSLESVQFFINAHQIIHITGPEISSSGGFSNLGEYGFVQFGGRVDSPRSEKSTLYNLICSDSNRVDLDVLLLCELARLLWSLPTLDLASAANFRSC